MQHFFKPWKGWCSLFSVISYVVLSNHALLFLSGYLVISVDDSVFLLTPFTKAFIWQNPELVNNCNWAQGAVCWNSLHLCVCLSFHSAVRRFILYMTKRSRTKWAQNWRPSSFITEIYVKCLSTFLFFINVPFNLKILSTLTLAQFPAQATARATAAAHGVFLSLCIVFGTRSWQYAKTLSCTMHICLFVRLFLNKTSSHILCNPAFLKWKRKFWEGKKNMPHR